jgi:hypothetical protein
MIIGSWKVIPASRPGMFQIPGTLVQPVIKTGKALGLTRAVEVARAHGACTTPKQVADALILASQHEFN